MPSPERAPAGFWLRYAAWSLDAACLLPLLLLLGWPILGAAAEQAEAALRAVAVGMTQQLDSAVASGQTPLAMTLGLLSDPRMTTAVTQLSSSLTTLLLTPPLLYALLAGLWSLAFECSRWQATPGKRALGLVVADVHGNRLMLPQALARFAAAGLSWLTLNLGHAMVLLAPHLALHDRLAHTRVLADPARPTLPTWGRAWLLLQGIAGLVAAAWLFVTLRDGMQALMAQTLGVA